MKKKIAFYCAHSFALYDVFPLFNNYDIEENDIYIITKKKYYRLVKEVFGINDDKIYFIDDYVNKIGSYFTYWFTLLFVSEDFSELYQDRRKIKYSNFQLRISNYLKVLNLKNNKVNTTYSKVINLFYKLSLMKSFPKDFDKVYVVTKVFHPYLLSVYEDKIHLIVESWDHPSKEPFLLNPFSVESWNESLNNELVKYQFYYNTTIGKALKFRYIEEYNKTYDEEVLNHDEIKDIEFVKNNDVAIYPICCSSSYFSFSEELRFVKDLALKLDKENIKLYVRPYPLAPYNDVAALKEIENVKVGIGNKLIDGLEVFDISHMLHKYLIIKHAKYVINLGTTFVFDAALVHSKCKIIQLKIDMKTYGDLGAYTSGTHVTNYLHVSSTQDFINFNPLKGDNSFKKYLKNWLNS
jgi:hypothetical protein